MLSREDNERLVRVGRGTPAGELFRRYWQPACLSIELPEKDGAPIRVRLLGEDLVAFRDTQRARRPGRCAIARIAARRCSSAATRNAGCAASITAGNSTSTAIASTCRREPGNQPDEGQHQASSITRPSRAAAWSGPISARRRPCRAPPDYEWMRAPATHGHISKTYEACNYLQGLEGGLDTAHSSYLHNLNLGNKSLPRQRDRAPQLEVLRSDYGYSYISTRRLGEDGNYVRVYHYVMPAQQMRGGINGVQGRNEVPEARRASLGADR